MTPLVFVTFSVIFLLLLCARTGDEKKPVQILAAETEGDHRLYRHTGITNSLKSIDFSLVSCWGDRKHQTVTIEYLLITKATVQQVAIHGGHVRAIDNRGSECIVKQVSLTLNASGALDIQSCGTHFKGKVRLQVIHSDSTTLAYTALRFTSGSSPGSSDHDHGVIEIRKLAIDWVA